MGVNIDKKITVLIVEDDANLRRILVTLIKKIGFNNIREADNGQNAWGIIINTNIGLLITDLNMPGMDGLQLTKMIRKNSKFQKIPILMITASDTKDTIVKAAKLGVNGYIIKPFNIKQVIEKIQDVFKNVQSQN